MLVADYDGNCISCFALEGTYVGRFNVNKGQLSKPLGLNIDMHGFVLVTDSDNCCVTVFDQDGVFVSNFGYYDYDLDGSYYPCGVPVSHKGNVYVTDNQNRRVQIY